MLTVCGIDGTRGFSNGRLHLKGSIPSAEKGAVYPKDVHGGNRDAVSALWDSVSYSQLQSEEVEGWSTVDWEVLGSR